MKKLIILMTACWLAISGAHAASAVEQLAAFNDKMQTFEATFAQELQDTKGKVTQSSSGKVYLQRPGRFRWNYLAPFKQEIVADGAKIWIYDADLEQVTVKRMNGALAETPAMLLIGKKPLEEMFEIHAHSGGAPGLAWVKLLPKTKDSGFEQLLLGFDAKDLRAMELVDSFGQTTRIRFEGVVMNKRLAATLFNFTPPAGVDVVGETE
ncbi:MAG: outer membrane lipoprotein chaperone LolA [Pseudomonadota bacterium]